MTVKSTGCGFDPPLEDMKYLFIFIFPFVRSGVEAKRGVEFSQPLNTQCLQNSAENGGERSVLILGSLCLPCSVLQREANLICFFFCSGTRV